MSHETMSHETFAFTKALVIHNRRVLILKRSNYRERGAGEWDIPGGGLDFGESPLEGIIREAREEAGIALHVDRLLTAYTVVTSPTRQGVCLMFIGHTDTDEITLSHEHTEFMWVTKQQLKELLSPRHLKIYTQNYIFEALDID